MSTTESFVTANDSGANNWQVDDGTTGRLRQGQTYNLTAFGNLSIPAGSTILGIECIMEGYASDANLGVDWIQVSNDDGTTFSTAKDINGTWSTDSSTHEVETAGSDTDLWGMEWNIGAAEGIRVKTSGLASLQAVFLDYFQVKITYQGPATTYPSDDNIIFNNGTLVLKGGTLEIK